MATLKNQYSNEFINEGIKYGELLLQSCKLSVEMFDPLNTTIIIDGPQKVKIEEENHMTLL